jgi:hypothetical protein
MVFMDTVQTINKIQRPAVVASQPAPAPRTPDPDEVQAAVASNSQDGGLEVREFERHAWFDANGDGKIDNVSVMDGGDAYLIGSVDGGSPELVSPGAQVHFEVPAPRTFRLHEQHSDVAKHVAAPVEPGGAATHTHLARAIAEYQKF